MSAMQRAACQRTSESRAFQSHHRVSTESAQSRITRCVILAFLTLLIPATRAWTDPKLAYKSLQGVYIGWLGHDNLGDEIVADIFFELLRRTVSGATIWMAMHDTTAMPAIQLAVCATVCLPPQHLAALTITFCTLPAA